MRQILFIALLILATSCNRADNFSTYTKFIEGYYNKDFNSITDYLSDTITIKDDGYEKKYTKSDFQVYYQWDSVFQPTHEILEIYRCDSIIDVVVSISSKRFEFLENNPMITRQNIYLSEGKITVIEFVESKSADWKVWIERRDSLVKWIDNNHKELSGFIYDMTKEGAEDYLKAIDLYQNE